MASTLFRAVQDYDGSHTAKCISLTTGDILSAVHAVDETWFIGFNERTKETGAFPIDCVSDIQEAGNDYSTLPGSPEGPKYANVSKMIQEQMTQSDDLDPVERARTLSMKANAFDASRLQKTKPEKKFRIKFMKRSQENLNNPTAAGEETAGESVAMETTQGLDVDAYPRKHSIDHMEFFSVKPNPVASEGTEQEDTAQTENRDSESKVQFSEEVLMHSVSLISQASWVDSFEMSTEHEHQDQVTGEATESYGKHADRYHSLEEDKEVKKKGRFRLTREKLFKSQSEENRLLKAVFGILAGFAMGCILFVVLVFSFGYDYLSAGVIVAVSTVIMCVCLALSSLCRCIMALVFPNFFTGKGRAVLLSIIFGVMLTSPIANIIHNAKETGSSLACMTELAANQSKALQRELVQPVNNAVDFIMEQKRKMDEIADRVDAAFGPVKTGLDDINSGVDTARKSLGMVVDACKQPVVEVAKKCRKACSSVTIISSFCEPACRQIDAVGDECNKLDDVDTELTKVANKTKASLSTVLNFLRADIEANAHFHGNTNVSKPIDRIEEEVSSDVAAKAEVLEVFMFILKKCLSLSLALVFIQSFWYLRNYLAKDAYDNVYITHQFRKMDKKNEAKGRPSILPLKKKEESIYVNTSSFKLNSAELAYCKLGLIQVLLHFLLCFLVILFDNALYYILNLVRKYGDIELEVGGQGRITLTVNGTGPMADFYREMLGGINLDQAYLVSLNTSNCLPDPTRPDDSTIPILLILYLLALFFVLLRGYGMRLRRKISAYYYPEQEEMRMDYLHKKIRHKRVGFLRFLRQQIKSATKENAVKEKLRLSTWLAFQFPCLEGLLAKHSKLECTSCEQKEHSFNDVKLTKCKGTTGGVLCDAIYCQECLEALKGACPLCSADGDIELRD